MCRWRFALAALVCLLGPPRARALDPRKSISQYTRSVWTQEHGLPQDTIRAIAQTTDGYLWLGTDEGLARFDGYDFTIFNRNSGALPSNTITALCAGAGGSLWIGTSSGLTQYQDSRFVTFTSKDGLPDEAVTALFRDSAGVLWIVAGTSLTRFANGRFETYSAGEGFPLTAVRAVAEDRRGRLWVAGFGGVVRRENGAFVRVIGPALMEANLVNTIREDPQGNIWISGSRGLLEWSPGGKLTHFGTADGLPDEFVRCLWVDRDGNVWAGTNGGLARLKHGRFEPLITRAGPDRDWVRAIFEDSEGDLWVGMNGGLTRFRDAPFTVYTRVEGAPSDEPTVVYEDHASRIWTGFHDSGLARLEKGAFRTYNTGSGLPSNEIFSIHEDRRGALLIATRNGFSIFRGGRFSNRGVADPMGRRIVFDVIEDRSGRIWTGSPNGLTVIENGRERNVIPGSALLNDAAVTLLEARDGTLWCGTYGRGLWAVKDGVKRLYTTAQGLSSDGIRTLYEDADGTLWIGTFGGGLNALRNGRFQRYTTREGLPSDNVANVEDDLSGSLWLATPRGICRLSKRQLGAFDRREISVLTPENYGVEDGLPSSQCAPGYPAAALGTRTSDGKIWFPTSRGLAAIDPRENTLSSAAPPVRIVDIGIEGQPVPATQGQLTLPAGTSRLQFRYTAFHLSAPERVRYEYRLEGLDSGWVQARTRRTTNYNSLRHGSYRFVVRAGIDGGGWNEAAVAFTVLPHWYEKALFRAFAIVLLCAAVWVLIRLRVRQLRGRFALVLEERARLAREIHDTLAQGFVGISSQLDAVEMAMPADAPAARTLLELAQKMARHSLKEARRSVMDLRSPALENEDLAGALRKAAEQWGAAQAAQVIVEADSCPGLDEETEQHLLRIAQEAVANALKHSHARRITIRLENGPSWLRLSIQDDGAGFEESSAFSAAEGHFGLLGMRERAERIGGKLNLHSSPGHGTRVELVLPL